MKRAIFAMAFLCLMAGYSEASEKFALGCFDFYEIQAVENRVNHRMSIDDYLAGRGCVIIKYDSRVVIQARDQFRLVEYQVGDGSVKMWTAWLFED